MKQSLKQSLGQRLSLTPSLQQAIKLLQLSTIELKQTIEAALESNPLLELEEESETELVPISIALADHSTINRKNTDKNSDTPSFETLLKSELSLQDYLTWQMQLGRFTETDAAIATVIIDEINDEGFFQGDLADVQKTLESNDIALDEVQAVLQRIQRFDPPGVGARNLQESLLLQLEQLDKNTPWIKHAEGIIKNSMALLEKRDYVQLMKQYKVNEHELKSTLKLIQSLDPHPGRQVATQDQEFVIPDISVHKKENRWVVTMNNYVIPRIKINADYQAMIKRGDKSEQNTYLRDNLQEARWLISSLQSRDETLIKVATSIVKKQHDFFERGPEAMKPMILQDIADELEMHESTISRVTTNKYMLTPHGVCELRFFFSSHVSTVTGEACSSTVIKSVIKKLIDAEQTDKPLSDSKIVEFLRQQGINVARRTIAKYREALSIPPSHERKILHQ